MSDDKETDEDFTVEASELDERTHAEMLAMFHEAAQSIRFSKTIQWKTLGFGILMQAGLLIFGEYAARRVNSLLPIIVIASTLVTTSAIYILIVHQLLQNMERRKLRAISERMSNLFQEVRSLRSSMEAAFHRYTLLIFMGIGLIGTCAFVIKLLSRLIR